MDKSSFIELAIIAFILVGIGYVIWRGGAANPVGTGRLEKDLGQLKVDVAGMKESFRKLPEQTASSEDIKLLEQRLKGEQQKIERFAAVLDRLDQELASLSHTIGERNAVAEALSQSVRSLSSELKAHQKEVKKRFDLLAPLPERIEANRQAIEQILGQLPAIRDKQGDMAREVAGIAARSEVTARQVDLIFQTIVPKGMQ